MALRQILKITTYGNTDRGHLRTDNEDSLLVDDRHRLYAVADGLGGLPSGSKASTLAMDLLAKAIKGSPELDDFNLETCLLSINTQVEEEGRRISKDLGIGTTLTVIHIVDSTMSLAHVGDSGLYLSREGVCHKLTVDHTMAQEMLDRLKPEDDPYIPDYYHHTLTRCIGQLSDLVIDTGEYTLQSGDRLLLYTDGITKMLEEDEIHQAINHAKSARNLVNQIIREANDRGGPDNSTAIAIFVD